MTLGIFNGYIDKASSAYTVLVEFHLNFLVFDEFDETANFPFSNGFGSFCELQNWLKSNIRIYGNT